MPLSVSNADGACWSSLVLTLLPSSLVQAHARRGGGRNERPVELPRERIEHDLTEHDKLCPGCGLLRQWIGCETSEQLEFIPAQLKVLEHVRWKYTCRHCQEHMAIAAPPAKPINKGLPGPGLLAQVAVGKFGDHLPLYRLEDVFARGGVELSRSTLCRWARCTAQLLEPLYQLNRPLPLDCRRRKKGAKVPRKKMAS